MLETLFIDEHGKAPGKGTAIARVVFVFVILAVPIGIAIAEYVRTSNMAGFEQAAGKITASELTNDTHSRRREAPYAAVIEAQFEYRGKTWRGRTSTWGYLTSDAAEADARRRKFVVGSDIIVWFEPAKLPEISLERESTTGSLIALGGFSVLAALVIWIYCIPQLMRAWNPQMPKPSRLNAGRRLLFGAGFVVAAVSLYWFFLQSIWVTLSSRSWTPTPAEVISVGTISHPEKVTIWQTDVLYSYEFNGTRYLSNQYNPTEVSSMPEGPRQQAISRYAPGQQVTCFVDPQNPSNATLTRHISPTICYGVWVLMFALLFGSLAFFPSQEKFERQIKFRGKTAMLISIFVAVLVVATLVAMLATP